MRKDAGTLAVAAGALSLIAAGLLAAGWLPRPATPAEQSDLIQAVRGAIVVPELSLRFDPSWPVCGLSEAQKAELRSRIVRNLRTVLTGAQLDSDMHGSLDWLDPASRGEAARVVEFRLERFDATWPWVRGDAAALHVSYRTYYEHAQVSINRANDQVWGGWADYDGSVHLDRTSGGWLVANLDLQETSEAEDTSLTAVPLTAPLPECEA
jgi:hypothetical protein